MATGPRKSRDPSDRVARRLLSEGRIGQELHDAALRHRSASGVRFEEALIEVGLSEEQLLRMLAEMYRVQYVSAARLGAAQVDKRTLALVPAPIAEQRQVVPVLLDRQKSVLSVVIADPEDAETLKEIELATQVRTVKPLLARPMAVRAAVDKFYNGDDFAFSKLDAAFDVAGALERDPIPSLSARSDGPPSLRRSADGVPSATSPPRSAPLGARERASLRAQAPRIVPAPSVAPPRVVPRPPPTDDPSPLPITLSPEFASKPPRSAAAEREPARRSEPGNVQRPPEAAPRPPEIIGDPFQLAVVMVSLLEGNRKDLHGHSIQTARLVRKVCEKLGADPARVRGAEIAALVHDFGKTSSYHLTPYNVARFEGHHAAAEKLYATPGRVVESAAIDDRAVNAVTHMYERYDGQGFPGGQRGTEIPVESRILAICDTYADLTSNPRNSFRKVLGAQEACDAIRELQGTVFDPKMVDHFVRVVLGDDIAERLRSDRGTVLLVDPDVEETTVLELALIEKRYDVRVARATDEAIRYLESGDVDIVVSEMQLPTGTGFDLLEWTRRAPSGHTTPFVFFSGRADSSTVARALDAGAVDYLFKPLATEVVVAKIRRLLEQTESPQKARGVNGSLEEMALPDLVQILHQGRKSGLLELVSEGEEGKIFFREGIVVDAFFRGLRGEDAFYAMVGVDRGQFRIDPSVAPHEETVHVSPEILLLEGMRRLDEAKR